MSATATIGLTASRASDPVTLEVVNQRLQSIADEMQTVLCRSAFSSIIKEAQDASAGLFDREGNAIAQAAALPRAPRHSWSGRRPSAIGLPGS